MHLKICSRRKGQTTFLGPKTTGGIGVSPYPSTINKRASTRNFGAIRIGEFQGGRGPDPLSPHSRSAHELSVKINVSRYDLQPVQRITMEVREITFPFNPGMDSMP